MVPPDLRVPEAHLVPWESLAPKGNLVGMGPRGLVARLVLSACLVTLDLRVPWVSAAKLVNLATSVQKAKLARRAGEDQVDLSVLRAPSVFEAFAESQVQEVLPVPKDLGE